MKRTRKPRHVDPETPASLSEREARFCVEFLVDYEGSAAAVRAGYAARSSKQRAFELLGRADVKGEIARVAKRVAEKAEADKVDVLRELALILRSDVRHFRVGDGGALILAEGAPDEAWRTVSSVKHRTVTTERDGNVRTDHTVEFRLWSKTDACRMLGEHHKLYTQKVEVATPAGSGVLAVPVPVGDEQWGAMAVAQQAALAQRPPTVSPKVAT